MAFSDYKNIEQVQIEFNISYHEERFIEERITEPSAAFIDEFAFNQTYLPIYSSEAARSEAIIFPIVREVYKPYAHAYELWIQRPLSYDQKLSGTPDYLISTRSPLGKTVLTLPILIVVEAKRNDFEQGWGQCLAELIAIQKLNNTPEHAVYGIVTDGKRWEIGKLLQNQFIQNIPGYTVEQLSQLFGALQAVFAAITKIKLLTEEGVKTSTPPPSPLPLTGEGVNLNLPPVKGGLRGVAVESIHGWSADKVQALQKRTAEFLNTPVEYQHDLKSGGKGPVMVVIPAGSFMMGAPDNEAERSSDERLHPLTLAKPFAMGKFAVTFEDYDRFCAATNKNKPVDSGWGRGRRPVINVNWNDAAAYCVWLSGETCQSYRLPTEAEWEYCCRAGSTTRFFWGDTINTTQANYSNNQGKTVPVDEFLPNAFGLYQMHGNVWEWTCSEYDSGYSSGKENTCLKQGNSDARAVRGGSWGDFPAWVRAALRFGLAPSDRGINVGVRLVQD